jgi:Uncharacterized protein conserved in bacteria
MTVGFGLADAVRVRAGGLVWLDGLGRAAHWTGEINDDENCDDRDPDRGGFGRDARRRPAGGEPGAGAARCRWISRRLFAWNHRGENRRTPALSDSGSGSRVRYPVGVGKAGKQWAGTTSIDGKYRNPAWSPPAEVRRDRPSMPDVIPGGSPRNPMGVAAMTLAGGEYAIHGTNMPGSVGGFVSYGCVRMYNEDITDLYQRVSVGTTVVVTTH